ncbi:MAG: efflux RND transporter permease subunit [Armatimonadetes bacterium]|nr:efflux RND transporter permease subunit [Armatimonadota bacterium]
MWLTRNAIERPFLTALLITALLVLGAASWRRLPVDLNPQASLPNVVVTAIFPGASPATVEELLARPFEDALRGVRGVEHVFSVSQESFCYCYVALRDGTAPDEALERCREAIGRIRGDLPEGMQEPAFTRLDINAQPVVFLGVTGQRPLEELRRLAEEALKPRLEAVPGVSEVAVIGGRQREIAIEVDREALLARGLLLSQLLEPLRASHRTVPGGRLQGGREELAVRVLGEFETLEDIRQVAIPPEFDPAKLMQLRRPPAREPSRATRLGDVAEVRAVTVQPEVRIRLQQREAVGLVVTKQGTANTVEVSRGVRAVVAAAGLPQDLEVLVARDTALTVKEALDDVNASIVIGVLLCALSIFLFLRNWHGTLIVATSMPVCLVGTFAFMVFGDHTLNQMTLLGLAISVGILVDDSIVCLEAITWRLQRGEPAAEAAFRGRNDIALADTSTTMIDLAVFAPIAFMGGVVGQFFHDLGFVVAVAAGLSLLAAYTVVPALAAYWYTRNPPRFGASSSEAAYASLEERYRRLLEWALGHRRLVLCSAWGGLALVALLAAQRVGVDFVPAADLSTVVVNLERPAGSSYDATEAVVAQAEAMIAALPEVATLFSTIGKIESGFGIVNRLGPEYAQISVTLRDRRGLLDRLLLRGYELRRRSDSAVADELRLKLNGLGDSRWQVIAVHGWSGAGAPVDFSLYGSDLERMAAVGSELARRLDTTPLLVNVDPSWRLGQPELQVRLDRRAAGELNVFPAAVGREVRTAIEGEQGLTMELGGEIVPVRLRLRAADRTTPDDLARLPVSKATGGLVTLGEVASITRGAGATRIDRRDGQRDLNFKAYLAEGISLGEARVEVERHLAALGVAREGQVAPANSRYPDLRWGWRGDADTLAQSSGHMARTALLGLVLTYGVMAVLFNSAVHPLTILLSVPIAIAGALLALALTGSSLSIVSGIGMILLLGIVVRNAILLIDHILLLRGQGIPQREAVTESGARRLRPILMTSITTILGMLPVALRIGKGAEIRAPMAIAVIGGLLLSTLLTLVIVPVTYTVIDDWRARRSSRRA